jgi:hypothetical protein
MIKMTNSLMVAFEKEVALIYAIKMVNKQQVTDNSWQAQPLN